MAKLRDKLWLWGHPEGRYNSEFGNTEVSRMTPLEGAMMLDCTGIFMVPVGIDVNRRQYNHSFKPMQRVGWECYSAATNPEVVEPLIKESGDFDNICCVVFDDFHRDYAFRNFDIQNLYKVHDRIHNNDVKELDMWMVLYTHEFGEKPEEDEEFMPFIEPFDGIIMWTWEEKNVANFEEKYKKFKEMTKGKRKMLGLYLYNFGEEKKATAKAVKWQLERYSELLKAGEVEGMVLHTNTMADLDHESYDACMEWLAVHADDEI